MGSRGPAHPRLRRGAPTATWARPGIGGRPARRPVCGPDHGSLVGPRRRSPRSLGRTSTGIHPLGDRAFMTVPVPDTLPALSAFEATLPALPVDDIELASEFARNEKAPATRRAYRSDFDLFRAWCEARRVVALPATPETVAAFLAAEAARGIRPSSIGRRAAAIRYAHKLDGRDDSPTNSKVVRATVRGIRRTLGTAKARKAPATADKMVAVTLGARRHEGHSRSRLAAARLRRRLSTFRSSWHSI